MKKLFQIGALSLALIISVFLLSNTTKAANGDVKIQINSQTGSCIYGTSLNFGSTGFSYNSRSLQSGFITSAGNNIWSCEDSEGDSGWTVQLASSDLLNMGNTGIKISSGNVLVIAATGTVISGTCIAVTGDSHGIAIPLSGATATILFGKFSALGQTCKVQSSGVDLKVILGSGQAPGQYSGTLIINLANSFDGIPN